MDAGIRDAERERNLKPDDAGAWSAYARALERSGKTEQEVHSDIVAYCGKAVKQLILSEADKVTAWPHHDCFIVVDPVYAQRLAEYSGHVETLPYAGIDDVILLPKRGLFNRDQIRSCNHSLRDGQLRTSNDSQQYIMNEETELGGQQYLLRRAETLAIIDQLYGDNALAAHKKKGFLARKFSSPIPAQPDHAARDNVLGILNAAGTCLEARLTERLTQLRDKTTTRAIVFDPTLETVEGYDGHYVDAKLLPIRRDIYFTDQGLERIELGRARFNMNNNARIARIGVSGPEAPALFHDREKQAQRAYLVYLESIMETISPPEQTPVPEMPRSVVGLVDLPIEYEADSPAWQVDPGTPDDS